MNSEPNISQSGSTIPNSLFTIPRIFAAEVKESFLMAMGALVAHKLRSALTLLGVMVGVFSIIVVMTTMRAMERNIERNFAQLGGDTFVVRKWPRIHFEGPVGEPAVLAAQQHHLAAGPGAPQPRHPPPQHRPGGRTQQRKHDLALCPRPPQYLAAGGDAGQFPGPELDD